MLTVCTVETSIVCKEIEERIHGRSAECRTTLFIAYTKNGFNHMPVNAARVLLLCLVGSNPKQADEQVSGQAK